MQDRPARSNFVLVVRILTFLGMLSPYAEALHKKHQNEGLHFEVMLMKQVQELEKFSFQAGHPAAPPLQEDIDRCSNASKVYRLYISQIM